MHRTTRLTLALLTLTTVLRAPVAQACFFPPPTRVRSVLPPDKATRVPTNARPRVRYTTGSQSEMKCGAKPAPPVLRAVASDDGGAPSDGGASEVAGNWVLVTDDDPRASTAWEFRAAAPLQPRTTYELLDVYSEDCDCLKLPPCPAGPMTVFARFTTGDGPDNIKPMYAGLLEGVCRRVQCAASDPSGCCGPTDHLTLGLMPALDAVDNSPFEVGVHYYLRKGAAMYDFSHPVGPGPGQKAEINSPVDSPYVVRWDIPLTDGEWHVIARAHDIAGNEDDNLVEASFIIPLSQDPNCAKVLVDGGMSRPDLMLPGLPDGTSMYPPDLAGGAMGGDGCNCALAQRRGPRVEAGAALAVVGLIAITLGRRARRRRRRAGAGATP